jgi:hypothetical protein
MCSDFDGIVLLTIETIPRVFRVEEFGRPEMRRPFFFNNLKEINDKFPSHIGPIFSKKTLIY